MPLPITSPPNRFRTHRDRCIPILQDLLSKAPTSSLDEQAFPAYVRGNALSRWLFWERISFCCGYVDQFGREGSGSLACLDFGCGSGLMVPWLLDVFDRVYGVDTELDASTRFLDAWDEKGLPRIDRSRLSLARDLAGVEQGSVDLVLALDVLEHVPDVPGLLRELVKVMKPNGRLLVSGPSENLLYRLGRRIVGFSGHYHERSIFDIRRDLGEVLGYRTLKRLGFPATLFLILEARKEG